MSSLAIAAAIAGALMFGCWLVSLRLRDASIVDPLWPMVFVAIAWGLWLSSGSDAGGSVAGSGGGRKLLLAAMVTLWGLRLGVHLAIRKQGEPEDYRYADMRRRWQPFALWSLVIVFGLQALLATVVSLPLQAVLGAAGNATADWPELGWLEVVGGSIWAVGLMFETVADWQLTRFRAAQASRREPNNTGELNTADGPRNDNAVLDSGLWRYSRHPNYFGDFLVWWGIYLVAAAAGAWWSIIGPALMTVLLVRVSGVALLERTIGERRPGYADYASRTSAFFPLPPRKRSR